jgi:hypothetical protein
LIIIKKQFNHGEHVVIQVSVGRVRRGFAT